MGNLLEQWYHEQDIKDSETRYSGQISQAAVFQNVNHLDINYNPNTILHKSCIFNHLRKLNDVYP